MKVRALKGYIGAEGRIKRGKLLTVPDPRGFTLIRRGLVAPVQMEQKPPPAVAKETPEIPFAIPRQPGFQTGEDPSSSSSEADHPPRRRRSRSRKAAPGQS